MAIKNMIVVAIFLMFTQAGCACHRRCCCDGWNSCPTPCPSVRAYTMDEGDATSPESEPQVAATPSSLVARRPPLELPLSPVPSHDGVFAK